MQCNNGTAGLSINTVPLICHVEADWLTGGGAMFAKRQGGLLVLVILVGISAIFGAVYLFLFDPDTFSSQNSDSVATAQKMAGPLEKACVIGQRKDWPNHIDLECVALPKDVQEHIGKVKIMESSVDISGVKGVYCQEALPVIIPDGPYVKEASSVSILLLHGMKFKSQTWVDEPMKTVQIMALLGHHVLACDLPGYGKTAKTDIKIDNAQFIEELMMKFKLEKSVIVSPSMSGSYALPFLIKRSKKLLGYVPVAPINTEHYKEQYPSINTPTLIIYGAQDEMLGQQSYKNLKLLPNSKTVVMENARHPAYLDQPARFHMLLNNFINIIKS